MPVRHHGRVEQGQLQQIADGYGIGGEQWTMAAQRRGDRLRTMVQVLHTDGQRWTGGCGQRTG